MEAKRVAIVSTHPIQYNAPLFQMLSARGVISIKVFYTWGQAVLDKKFDPGFGRDIQWDIPLLEGYEYEFVDNTASAPGSHHFKGIVNPTLISRIADWKADALIVFGWNFKSHLRALRHFKKRIPVFFRGDSTLLDEVPGISWRKMLRRTFLKWIYRHVDFALYAGGNNRAYFKAHGLKDTQLIHCPHAIDVKRFHEPDETYRREALALRRSLGIPDHHRVFLFAGKLEAKKNASLLIAAFTEQPEDNASLIIVGNGVQEASLKKQAQPAGNIYFLDFQNQSRMPVIYRLADIFVLPSQGPGETWGLAANEAMACGCALLMSTKCGGAIDLVVEDRNGYVFESNNLADLISKRDILMKKDMHEFGTCSRSHILNFSFDRVCQSIEQAMEKQA